MREFTEQELVRRKKLENIKNPYPERYETNYSIKDASMLEDGTTNVSVAALDSITIFLIFPLP